MIHEARVFVLGSIPFHSIVDATQFRRQQNSDDTREQLL